jgi:hypothetical protein
MVNLAPISRDLCCLQTGSHTNDDPLSACGLAWCDGASPMGHLPCWSRISYTTEHRVQPSKKSRSGEFPKSCGDFVEKFHSVPTSAFLLCCGASCGAASGHHKPNTLTRFRSRENGNQDRLHHILIAPTIT